MKKSPLPTQNVAHNEKFSRKEELVKILKQHFGHSEFRGRQLEAIEAVLSGRDCFCLMPTGGGKSMCYQVPALLKSGIVLVVCPLIALMENQVMALKEKKIAAEYLSSTQTSHVREKIHEDLSSGKPSLRLLYVTPELIATQGFMSKLTKLYSRGLLNLIAIDEAHCVSTWGHDFRPSYRNLSSLRKRLPDVPILALTATAAPKVEKDVVDSLCLRHPLILRSSFNRPNIFYEVRYKDLLGDAYADLSNQLKSSGDACSIVYCLERTTCDNLSAHLLKNGISCAAYHAGLNSKLRSSVLDDWLSSRIQVVVATVAFGMGIDRKDVRIVCHFNIPKSMEGFYQESGRAGRDQMPSRSLLYYGIDDYKKMEFILSSEKKKQTSGSHDESSKKSLVDFKQMVEYCEGSGCRRRKILESFGEQVPVSLCKNSCDACKDPNLVAKYLEELSCSYNLRQKNGGSRIFISSTTGSAAEDQYTEFWNHDDEASVSEEDISDSDDDAEVVRNLTKSKKLSKSGLNDKIEFLEQAEERYYQNKTPSKQNSGLDKKAISEALREASRKRLLNALKQAEQRLGNLRVEFEASAGVLENECYKKYGKVGKTFYNSQLASTVRWLSSSNLEEITNRLGTSVNRADDCQPSPVPIAPAVSLADRDDKLQNPSQESKEENHDTVGSSTCSIVPQTKMPSQEIELPPILSFSQFVKKKGKEGEPDPREKSAKRLPTTLKSDSAKKMRK